MSKPENSLKRLKLSYIAVLAFTSMASAHAGSPLAVIDLTSFQGRTLEQVRICEQDYAADATTASGASIKMLGMAVTYFSAANGNSLMGHVGERFIYCRDSQLVDVLYEFFPLGEDRLNDEFEKDYDVALTPERRQALKGRFFVARSMDPTRAYGISQFFRNRSIHEAWLGVEGVDSFKALQINADRYTQQKEKIQTDEALPEYHLVGRNCATPVISDLKQIGRKKDLGRFSQLKQLPRLLFGAIQKHAEFRISYPSQREFRILKLKEEGLSTRFEKVVPLSQASDNRGAKWMLIYPDGWMKPLAGVVNAPMALAEVGAGIFTLKGKRIKRGVGDLVASAFEMIGFRTRYPNASPWTEDEESFFAGLDVLPAVTNYLAEKFPTDSDHQN